MSVPYQGDYQPGAIVTIWHNSFTSDDPSASVTMTNYTDTDVHIYKDDSLTQRQDTVGMTLDIDVDTYVGVHKITIDTANNNTANFWEAGHDYAVVIEGTTIDGATVNAAVATFSIANRRVAGHMCSTSIEGYTNTTNFTLTAGEASGDNDAYNGCAIIVTDQVTKIQKGIGHISDYVGNTRAIVLHAAPLATAFTWAIGDSVEIFATAAFANVNTVGQTTQTANDNGADINSILTGTVTNAQGADVATDVANMIDGNNRVDVGSWLGTAVTLSTGNQPDVNVDRIDDVVVSTVATDGKLHALNSGGNELALASVLGALDNGAAVGEVTTGDTLMQYIKQLLNVLIGSTGIGAWPGEQAPANGINLFEAIRAIHADVTGLNGSAMVGTNGANTTTPPTVTQIQAEMEANGTSILDAIADLLPGSTIAAATDIPAMVGTDNAATAAKLEAYVQLLVRKDSAISSDRSTELAEINANEGSGAGSFSNQTDSLEALKDGILTDIETDTAEIGSGVALDSGTATIAGMLTKMADDGGGATFDAGEDSLNKIRDDRTLAAADYTVVGDTLAAVTNIVNIAGSGAMAQIEAAVDSAMDNVILADGSPTARSRDDFLIRAGAQATAHMTINETTGAFSTKKVDDEATEEKYGNTKAAAGTITSGAGVTTRNPT